MSGEEIFVITVSIIVFIRFIVFIWRKEAYEDY